MIPKLTGSTSPFASGDYTHQDIARDLLKGVGCNEPDDEAIAATIAARDAFIKALEATRCIT